MGYYYLRTHDGKELRPYNEAEKSTVLREFYTPHHERLTVETQKIIDEHGFGILVDCHSYDDSVSWVSGKDCPDICLGLNAANPVIEQTISDLCIKYGYSCAVNTPFAGSIIPNNIDSTKLFSIMLEINKRIYGGRKTDNMAFERLQDFAENFIQLLLYLVK